MEKIIERAQPHTTVHQGKHYIVANVSEETIRGDMRGWICGHFYPEGSPFHRYDIEICIKTLPVDLTEEAHHHLCSFEFLVVLDGKVEYNLSGDHVMLTTGMFYMLEPGNIEHIIKVHEPTTILAVRLPSIPHNKILEKTDHE